MTLSPQFILFHFPLLGESFLGDGKATWFWLWLRERILTFWIKRQTEREREGFLLLRANKRKEKVVIVLNPDFHCFLRFLLFAPFYFYPVSISDIRCGQKLSNNLIL
jgi:hypothetical protein